MQETAIKFKKFFWRFSIPQPKPSQETEQEFVERCIPVVLEDGTAENREQAAAICHSMYEQEAEKMTEDKTFVKIDKTDEEKQLLWGVVYPPNIVDSQGEAMTKEEIEKAAYNFMKKGHLDKIDIGHNFKESGSCIVENFIARKEDPDFPEGSWVMAVWCPDDVWQQVKDNELNGFSFAGTAKQKRARVMLEVAKEEVCETSENTDDVLPKHKHLCLLRYDVNGRVVSGCTDNVIGHSHEVKAGTAVEKSLGHGHRIYLD